MKRKTYLETVLLLLCLYLSGTAHAQHTGSYDTTVTFTGSPRAVSMYVPPTYNPSVAYRLMVCLHGLGDTCTNYRNALTGSAAWPTNIPNTIFVFPEAANRNADYFYPSGGEAIILTSIDMARSIYNIDTNDIVLQGFSLGGRAALRYGLDHYEKFKGLLLNTPAIQGVKEAINDGVYTFNYANASHIPIYITHGADDVIYTGPIDSTYEQLILQNGVVRYYDFPGLAHTIPPIASIINFLSFFSNPASTGYDLDMVKASIPQRSCTPALPATCLVRNTGTSTIHTINLQYTVAGSPLTYIWTGSLAPFQHAVIALPTITAPTGSQVLSVSVVSLETGISDTVTANNSCSAPFQVEATGTPFPVFRPTGSSTNPVISIRHGTGIPM